MVKSRITQLLDALTHGSTRFGHDVLGNLAWAQYADNRIVHRAADETGNVYETKEKTDRKYSAAGALLESRKYIFKYDEEGNLISKTEKATERKTKYEWYASGMLKQVTKPDGKEVVFKYDALGRRIEKTFDGTVTRWLWDGNTPLHEWSYKEEERPRQQVGEWGDISYDKKEPITNLITWLFDEGTFHPSAKITEGKTQSIICDYLGTPQMMFDESGNKTWEAIYDIYGRCINLIGQKLDCPFRYQGQYEDAETGLYYNRFRYYSAEEGNYISQDPIGLSGGMNLHAYVHDANSWVDPSGLAGMPSFEALKDMAQNSLDFSTAKGGAVFWSGDNMNSAQKWAANNGKTTLEQTMGGKYLNDLRLFDKLAPHEAAEVWDIASKRFADGASGKVHAFSTGAKKMNRFGGIRTWWRVEKPALLKNENVSEIIRMKKDGSKAKNGHIKCK